MHSYQQSGLNPSQQSAANTTLARLMGHLRTPLYRNGYALTLNSLSNSVLGMGYWILAARNYSTATVGLNSAAISAMMFLAGVAQLNMMSGLVRFVPGAGRVTARFVAYTYVISVSLAAVVSFIFLRGLHIWAPTLGSFGSSPFLVGWFTFSTMAWCIFTLQDSALTGLRQAVWVPVENTVFGVAKIALLIGLARSVPQYGLFASWTIGMAITLLPVNALIFRYLIPKHIELAHRNIEPLIRAEVVRFVAADYIGSLAWFASTGLLPLLVIQQAGASANAYYFLSWQIVLLLISVCNSMGASLVVEAMNDPTQLRAYTRRVFIQIARMVIPAAVLLVLGAPFLLRVFGSNYAAQSSWSLRFLALSAIPFIVNSLYANVARVQRRLPALVTVQLASCVLVLTMSHFLLQMYGVPGVGLAWLVSQTLIAVIIVLKTVVGSLRPSRLYETVPEEELVAPDAVELPADSALADGAPGKSTAPGPALAGRRRSEPMRHQIADWFFSMAVRLGLLPLPPSLRNYRANRRHVATAAKLLPSILPAITLGPDMPPRVTWVVHRLITTDTDVTVVRVGPPRQSSPVLLKLARTCSGIASLRRQTEVLANLNADSRLGEWRTLLPTVLATGECEGQEYVAELMLPGCDARSTLVNPDVRARMLVTAATAIGELHRRTAALTTVDSGLLEHLIEQPLSALRHCSTASLTDAGTDQAIARLAAELREALSGRSLSVSWIHGDFWPGNIRITPDGTKVLGIVDWDQAVPDGLPLLDTLMLLLFVRMAVQRTELGGVVRALLNGTPWTRHEQALLDMTQAALPGDAVELRSLVLLCWLRHIATAVTTSTRYNSHDRRWARSNIQAVLRCL
jgi:O-antigen/teichoic acid export membrane protein